MPLKGKAKVKTQLDLLIEKLERHLGDRPWDWNDRRCTRCLKRKQYYPHAWCKTCHRIVLDELEEQIAKPATCVGAGIEDGWEYYMPALDRAFRDWAKGKASGKVKHIRGSIRPPPTKPPFFH